MPVSPMVSAYLASIIVASGIRMLKDEIEECLLQKLIYPDDTQLYQRGIADKIEQECNRILVNSFNKTELARSRRSVEDITVNDYYVDHKTSDVSLKFKMPNLISIDRLKRLDKPLLYNFVKYDSHQKKILGIMVLDVYELNWEHLKIENLGAGQLQIKNMEDFYQSPKSNISKEEWLNELHQNAISFYNKLLGKTQKRIQAWKVSLPQ